jgi:hypothetical protein
VTEKLKGFKVRNIKLSVLLLMCLSMAGCGTLSQVQAWEKGKLARQDMRFDRDLLDAKYVDHTYFSKEAATGGTSVGGGGCGCN